MRKPVRYTPFFFFLCVCWNKFMFSFQLVLFTQSFFSFWSFNFRLLFFCDSPEQNTTCPCRFVNKSQMLLYQLKGRATLTPSVALRLVPYGLPVMLLIWSGIKLQVESGKVRAHLVSPIGWQWLRASLFMLHLDVPQMVGLNTDVCVHKWWKQLISTLSNNL